MQLVKISFVFCSISDKRQFANNEQVYLVQCFFVVRGDRGSQKYCNTWLILIISLNRSRSKEQIVKIPVVLMLFLTCGDSAWPGGIGKANLERSSKITKVLQNLANIDNFAKPKAEN